MRQILLLSFPLFICHSIFYDPISMTVVVSVSSTKSWHGVTQWSNTLYITFSLIWKANEYWYNMRHGTDVTLREIQLVNSIPVKITLSINLNFTPNHVATVSAHFKRQSDESTIPSKVLVQHIYAIFLTVIFSYVSGPTFSWNEHFLKKCSHSCASIFQLGVNVYRDNQFDMYISQITHQGSKDEVFRQELYHQYLKFLWISSAVL